MNFKRIFALALAVLMLGSLAACGADKTPDTPVTTTTVAPTDNNTDIPNPPVDSKPTDPQPNETKIPDGMKLYTVKLVDEGGNPVTNGGVVQICLNELCNPCMVNDGGTFSWTVEPADYKVSFIKLPQGYEVANGESAFYFTSGSTEMTIVLRAVA